MEHKIKSGEEAIRLLHVRRGEIHMSARQAAIRASESGMVSQSWAMGVFGGQAKNSPSVNTFLGIADALGLEVVVRPKARQ